MVDSPVILYLFALSTKARLLLALSKEIFGIYHRSLGHQIWVDK